MSKSDAALLSAQRNYQGNRTTWSLGLLVWTSRREVLRLRKGTQPSASLFPRWAEPIVL